MKKLIFALSIFAVFAAQAAIVDRPSGIRIGQRLTIRPYVSLYYTWDSNIDSSPKSESASSFNVNPGLTFTYKADNWSIAGGAYYQYHAYTENARNLNQGSWGENLAFNWTNSKNGGRGWSLVLRENIQQISQDDDMMRDGGRGMGRDRMQMQFAGVLQRRFTDKFHADVDASYYYLNYDNDKTSYAPLYGWTRWTVGGQAGYAASKWTDFIFAGNYQGYTQQNNDVYGTNPYGLSRTSQGFTLLAGLGSYATERISYRVMGGYSQFRYSDGNGVLGGFTYEATGQWRMNDTWNMMLLASSYYQPDENTYGSAQRVDSLSWGLAHSMIRNKLTATFDIAYRRNDRESVVVDANQRTENIITTRLGLNYTLNRFLQIFGHAEYQHSFDRGDSALYDSYNWDYDRWRLSVGLRLTY